MVLGAWWMPNLAASSSAILSSPQPGWSVEMRLMKAMCSRGMRGRPIFPGPDLRRQIALNPLRCQPTTVAGFTMTSERVESDHRR